MELRKYQAECIEKIVWSKQNNLPGNDLIVLPTGAGKSVVIANLIHRINEPALILQPSKEILEQNYGKLCMYVDPKEIGIYSASMNEKTINRYTFATIQSIYKKPELFAHFKLVVMDECHLLNPKSLEGMFTYFLKKIGSPKVIGLTATPYRMCTKFFDYGQPSERVEATIKLINRMKGFFWQRILYSLNVEDLIRDGYLCQLEYINKSVVQQSDIKLNVSRSDFDMEDLEYKMSTKKDEVAQIITWAEQTSKSVLVFCPSVKKATTLSEATLDSAVVSAKTPKKIRERIIKDFKEHRIKTVFNVGVLTTGFDHPALDCIILMRPTRSIALYYQMLGRGLRICEGKTTCKIIDLTGTVKEMGRVETIKLVKRNLWELESETGSWHDSELFVHYTKDGGKEFDNHNTLENALLSVKYPKAAPIVAAEEDDDEIIVEGIPFN